MALPQSPSSPPPTASNTITSDGFSCEDTYEADQEAILFLFGGSPTSLFLPHPKYELTNGVTLEGQRGISSGDIPPTGSQVPSFLRTILGNRLRLLHLDLEYQMVEQLQKNKSGRG